MPDTRVLLLYYLCAFAGLVMVVGGIYLLAKQKIYLDRESKQVTEVETPIGKFKTNYPALVLFVLGFIPLASPMWLARTLIQEVRIVGRIESTSFPVQIYAAVATDAVRQNGEFRLEVPRLSGADYRVIYVAGNLVLEDYADLQAAQKGKVVVPPKDIQLPDVPKYRAQVRPRPAEFAR